MRLTAITLSLLFMFACGTKKADEKSETQSVDSEQSTAVEGPKANSDCEDFLDDYEKYVNEFLEMYEKLEANPMDAENMQKMMEGSQKMLEWTNKWQTMHDCANNDEYMERMDELSKKIEEATE